MLSFQLVHLAVLLLQLFLQLLDAFILRPFLLQAKHFVLMLQSNEHLSNVEKQFFSSFKIKFTIYFQIVATLIYLFCVYRYVYVFVHTCSRVPM